MSEHKTMDGYRLLPDAKTLGELRDRIDEAITVCGEDAEWNGFDDGAIVIHADGQNCAIIFPD